MQTRKSRQVENKDGQQDTGITITVSDE